LIGAARHERADTRTSHRNGNRSRVLSTKTGDVELAIPKLRRVHFLRNVSAKVPKGSAEMVAAAVRTIFAQPDAAAVADQLDSIAAKLGRQFPAVETMVREVAVDICA
jgi:transposase-like protein